MKSVFNFLVKPKSSRYNNEISIGDKKLITNTEIFDHKSISREAVVLSTPAAFTTVIKEGDSVILHHNVFRRWHDIKGQEKNSSSYLKEDLYSCQIDQIYAFKEKDSINDWKALDGYSFVQPIKNIDKYNLKTENELVGILIHASDYIKSKGLKNGDLVGIGKNSQYEFVIDGKLLYRVLDKHILIKYEYTGNEERYNPSWARSG